MIVVADTSPINYLVLIQHIEILPRLYQRVLIPTAVERELLHAKTPQAVRAWMDNRPDWLEVRSVNSLPDPSMADLDSGEAEAIYLAEEVRAHQIIVDETFGRRVAESRGLQVIGTLGILREASQRNLLNFREAIDRLRKTRFHIAQHILDDMLANS
jgi:predicted nucleic acid-binding protein